MKECWDIEKEFSLWRIFVFVSEIQIGHDKLVTELIIPCRERSQRGEKSRLNLFP
jgi:hypothetical protein